MGSIADLFMSLRLDDSGFVKDVQISAGKAGDAGAKTFGDKFRAGFKGLKADIGQTFKEGLGIGAGLGAINLVSTAIRGVTDYLGGAITAASDLNETVSKSRVIFGAGSSAIEAWAKAAATSMGQSEKQALDTASGFAGLFQTVGLAADEAAGKSKDLTQLGADLASFFNTDVQTAIDSLKSGLAGESEPLRKFNVFLSETAVNSKLASEGVQKVGGQFTEAQKATARYQLIMEQTSRAQGDFARTSDGLANSQRINTAELDNSTARIGQLLLPLWTGLAHVMGKVVLPAFAGLIELISKNAVPITIALGAIGTAVALTVVPAFVAWAAATVLATWPLLAIGAAVAALAIIFKDQIGPALDLVSKGFNTLADVAGKVFSGIIGIVKNVVDVIASFPNPFQDAAKQLSGTLAGMQTDFNAWGDGMATTSQGTADGVASPIVDMSMALPGAVGDNLAAGASDVAAGADKMAAPIPEAVKSAKDRVKELIDGIPSSIKGALQDGKKGIKDASDNLKWAIAHPQAEAHRITALEAQLTSKDILRGLQSKSPEVRAAAIHKRELVQAELERLRNSAFGFGKDTIQNLLNGFSGGLGGGGTWGITLGITGGSNRPGHEAPHGGGRASGGPFSDTWAGWVGERGREWLQALPGGGGFVIPHSGTSGFTMAKPNLAGPVHGALGAGTVRHSGTVRHELSITPQSAKALREAGYPLSEVDGLLRNLRRESILPVEG